MSRCHNLTLTVLTAALNLLLLAPPAAAQSDSVPRTPQVQLLRALPAGTPVRVSHGERWHVGELRGVDADSVRIGGLALPVERIGRVQLRQRATTRGLKLGALGGAATGAVGFGVIGAWLSLYCGDGQGCTSSAGEAALEAGALGAVLGAITGAAAGAIIGASTTRWTDLSPRVAARHTASTQQRPLAPVRGTVGSVSAVPAYTRPVDGDGSGYGGRATLLFHRGNLAAGPELGFYELGSRQRLLTWNCDEEPDGTCSALSTARETVAFGSAIARVGAGAQRTIEPYATAGVGLYSWHTDIGEGQSSAGYSAGGGVHLRTRRGWHGAFLEARWQSNLTAVRDDYRMGFISLGAGGTLAW